MMAPTSRRAGVIRIAGLMVILASCSDGQQPAAARSRADVGGVKINLEVGGSTLTEVDLNVYEGSDTSAVPVLSKMVSVAEAPMLEAFTGALTAGDYTATFVATASDGTPCSGMGGFNIVAGTTVATSVDLVCSATFASNKAKGQYVFLIQFVTAQSCPFLEDVTVTPLQTSGVVSLSTQIVSPSPTPASPLVAWTDGGQTLFTSQAGVFDCGSRGAGTHSITVTATVPGSSCASSLSTPVTCVSN